MGRKAYVSLFNLKKSLLLLFASSLENKNALDEQKYAEIVNHFNSQLDKFQELIKEIQPSPLPPVSSKILLQMEDRPSSKKLTNEIMKLIENFKENPFSDLTHSAFQTVNQTIDNLSKSIMTYSGISVSNVSTVHFVNQLDLNLLKLYDIIFKLLFVKTESLSGTGTAHSLEYDWYLRKFSDLLDDFQDDMKPTLQSTTPRIKLALEYNYRNLHDLLIAYTNLSDQKVDINTIRNLAERSIDKLYEMSSTLNNLMEDVIDAKQAKTNLYSWIIYATFFVYFATMLFWMITRFMSNHLRYIINSLKIIESGDYRELNLTKHSDDIGKLSQGFMTLVSSVNAKLNQIDHLNGNTIVSKFEIDTLMNIQKKNMNKFLEGVDELDLLIKEISNSAKSVNDKIEALQHDTEKTSQEEKAKKSFDKLMEHMALQKSHSSKIIGHLQNILSNVFKTMGLVDCLNKVGNQTQLLYLNAAIEATVAKEYRESFMNTVNKLDRFSINTNTATTNITRNTRDLYYNTKDTLQVFNKYMIKGGSCSEELNVLQTHLIKITEEFSKQGNEFGIIKNKMNAAVNEIGEISKLLKNFKDATDKNIIFNNTIDKGLDTFESASVIVDETLRKFQYSRANI